jgi:CpeT/CpcT family (DUF1001)
MNTNIKIFYFIIALFALNVCHFSRKAVPMNPEVHPQTNTSPGRMMDSFTYLKKCMQGNFSSIEQSKSDSDYFDIRLRMVPIWSSNASTFYLYVEQAMSTALDAPYRQRIYKVVKNDNLHFSSYIYTIPQPKRFVGKLEGDAIFNIITPDSLTLKDGCEVNLTFNPDKWEFSGSTGDKTCPSDRSGAAWATSVVTINDQRMISWDQGWDKDGKQVWGAVKGGYIFMKE